MEKQEKHSTVDPPDNIGSRISPKPDMDAEKP